MKILITPAEVAVKAFGGEENISVELITETAILAAQKRYILPVLGKPLWAALERGEYSELLSDWVKPALALYVKYSVLPAVAAQTGALGVVRYSGEGFVPADDKSFQRMLRGVRIEADALLDATAEFIESALVFFPEYNSTENIRNNISIIGGVVL